VVAVSSLAGVPPLYGVSLAAGALRLPAGAFVVIIVVGRVIRFAAVYLAPALFK
jgi:membrane protein YqaA with SNARE-associated domain